MPTKKKTSPTKKPAAKKAAKKTAAKKTAAKKPVTKKVAKKATKKTAAKKTATKKVAKKATTKKVAKKATTKKVAKTAAKKVAKKATKKTAAKKTAAKKTATKKTATKKTATKKAPAKKAAAKSSLATALAASPAALDAYGALSSKKTAALTTDKVAKKPAAKADAGHGELKLPAKKKALDVGGYAPAPSSKRAAVTVVPAGDDVDDALDDAMDDAFAAVFVTPPASAKAKPSAPFVAGEASLDLAQTCASLALEKKADNVVILQVAELTSYADYFVIAAASSERQAQAVARNIADELRRRGKQPLSTDGLEQGNWVIVDYGAVVVHVFMESARAYYDLDGFWIDAPRVEVDEAQGKGALENMGS